MADRRMRSVLHLLLVLSLSGCDGMQGAGGQTGDEFSQNIQLLEGSVERRAAEGPALTSASEELGEFAWSFYAETRTEAENFVYSPLSLSVAASMLYAGSTDGTQTEMQQVFSFADEGEEFHQARNVLLQHLEGRSREGGEDADAQELRLSNDFWMSNLIQPEPSFLDVLSEFYGAPVHLFEGAPEDVRKAINHKVSEDTNALIDELLPEDSIDEQTVFVLTNALYFKSNWQTQFLEDGTAPAPFQMLDGSTQNVDMMHAPQAAYPYTEVDGIQVLSMPYSGRELEFVAVMPPAGTFNDFVATLDQERMNELEAGLDFEQVLLSFPKMHLNTELPLREELMQAGMLEAFTAGEADFGPISDEVFLTAAFHQAELILDEAGTEAAAATAFVGGVVSIPPPPIEVTFDRPFVFFIRDVETQALLFLGHFVSP